MFHDDLRLQVFPARLAKHIDGSADEIETPYALLLFEESDVFEVRGLSRSLGHLLLLPHLLAASAKRLFAKLRGEQRLPLPP